MEWVRGISEGLARSIDWIWLEGRYWAISIRFVGKGFCRQRTECEDERIRDLDVDVDTWYCLGDSSARLSKSFDEEHFVLRVDYRHFEEDALAVAKKMATFVQRVLSDSADSGGNGSLGRGELAELLEQTPLTTSEQDHVVGSRRF